MKAYVLSTICMELVLLLGSSWSVLFFQIGSRSSVYSPESRVRKVGSFIYEDFMPTDGTDVKVSNLV